MKSKPYGNTKRCPKCQEDKPLSEFGPSTRNPQRLRPRCHPCESATTIAFQKTPKGRIVKIRAWRKREANLQSDESIRRRRNATNRERRRADPREKAKDRANAAKMRKRYPERIRSRQILGIAVRTGFIKKPISCERCNIVTRLHGHHTEGYDAPLKVAWLCAECHGKEHRGRARFLTETHKEPGK